MELINREHIKLNRIPLPSIKPSYKSAKSDYKFKSAEKNYNNAGNNYIVGSKNLDTSTSDNLGLEVICIRIRSLMKYI